MKKNRLLTRRCPLDLAPLAGDRLRSCIEIERNPAKAQMLFSSGEEPANVCQSATTALIQA